MAYWLVKSEPSVYSINDLRREETTLWSGVRNYQARNYLRSMEIDDLLFFYHSVDEPIGIAGVAKVVSKAEPDPTQFDLESEYFDPKATCEKPRWFCPRVSYVSSFQKVLPRKDLLSINALSGLELLKARSRLSVQPVSAAHFKIIYDLARSREVTHKSI